MTYTAKDEQSMKISSIAGTLGLVAGLVYAFEHKKKFWAYVGYGLLGFVVFSGVAYAGSSIIIKEK